MICYFSQINASIDLGVKCKSPSLLVAFVQSEARQNRSVYWMWADLIIVDRPV